MNYWDYTCSSHLRNQNDQSTSPGGSAMVHSSLHPNSYRSLQNKLVQSMFSSPCFSFCLSRFSPVFPLSIPCVIGCRYSIVHALGKPTEDQCHRDSALLSQVGCYGDPPSVPLECMPEFPVLFHGFSGGLACVLWRELYHLQGLHSLCHFDVDFIMKSVKWVCFCFKKKKP